MLHCSYTMLDEFVTEALAHAAGVLRGALRHWWQPSATRGCTSSSFGACSSGRTSKETTVTHTHGRRSRGTSSASTGRSRRQTGGSPRSVKRALAASRGAAPRAFAPAPPAGRRRRRPCRSPKERGRVARPPRQPGDVTNPPVWEQPKCQLRPGTQSSGCRFPGLEVQGSIPTPSTSSGFISDFTHLDHERVDRMKLTINLPPTIIYMHGNPSTSLNCDTCCLAQDSVHSQIKSTLKKRLNTSPLATRSIYARIKAGFGGAHHAPFKHRAGLTLLSFLLTVVNCCNLLEGVRF
jgi:hypothetical protein